MRHSSWEENDGDWYSAYMSLRDEIKQMYTADDIVAFVNQVLNDEGGYSWVTKEYLQEWKQNQLKKK